MPRFLPVFLVSLAMAISVSAQDAKENEPLIKLQQSFDLAYENGNKPIAELDVSYKQALQRLFKAESSASKLDSALQVKAEIDGFGNGSNFSPEAFKERQTDNPALSSLRRKYLAERDRLRNLGKKAREELLAKYQTALQSLESQQTQSGQVELALQVRNVREALAEDARFNDEGGVVAGNRSVSCQVHLVAKGDIELTLNGSRLSYRNVADQRKKYVDGTVRPTMVRAGDILRLKMRSEVVFRSLIIGLESEDGDLAIPIKLDDYRYLGIGDDVGEKLSKPEEILRLSERPDLGNPDHLMSDMWLAKSFSKECRDQSEWIKIGPSSEWYHYVVVIRDDMFVPVEKDSSARE